MKNNLQNLSDEQRRKILAAAEIVDGGDMAVLKKIIEFDDTIESATEKIDEFGNKIDETITEAKTKLGETIDSAKKEFETIKEEIDAKLSEVEDGETPSEEELKSIILPLIPKVKDGKTPTKKELIDLIKPLIPEPVNGENPNPEDVVPLVIKKLPPITLDDRQKIVEKINSGKKSDTKIEASQIEGIATQKELDRAIGILDKRTQFLINKPTGTSGSTTFIGLTDVPASYTSQALKVLRVNAGETGLEFTTLAGGGDALKADPLSQFAATTSAQLAGVISDETGSGSLVFGTSPSITAPTFATSITGSYLTASELLITDGSKNIVSAPVATYPSLTEFSYVKGVTSAIQTQLNAKLANVVEDTTPQLGGSLDVNGQKIVSVSNGNIDIEPHGTGNVLLGNFTFDADQTVGAGQDNYILTYDNATGLISLEAASGGGANTALSNLAAVAINTTLVSDTDNTDDLGTSSVFWRTGYFKTSIELGDTSTTITGASGVLSVEGVVIPTISSTNTLTNKRITKRVVTAADATSVTPNSDNADWTYQSNTQATGTLTINADTGTPTNAQAWGLKIKSTNVQTFSWNSVFVGGDTALPTTTTGSSQIDYFTFIYDTVDSKWHFTGKATNL